MVFKGQYWAPFFSPKPGAVCKRTKTFPCRKIILSFFWRGWEWGMFTVSDLLKVKRRRNLASMQRTLFNRKITLK